MEGSGKWIASGAIGLLGFLGLYAAARAADEAFFYGGWLVAILCVGYLFLAIHRHYNAVDAEMARKRAAEAERTGGTPH
ncbi:hypothetical protein [Azospirillum halopraeferens]|uniref:hypothetical protein n=1 Tax=Azospirillum halopraeferens TaxID=34010 RepID=UPI0004251FA7|nr:hypothetical protein [Azospirillum halopraeferens]